MKVSWEKWRIVPRCSHGPKRSTNHDKWNSLVNKQPCRT